jgi:hypothetical protein
MTDPKAGDTSANSMLGLLQSLDNLFPQQHPALRQWLRNRASASHSVPNKLPSPFAAVNAASDGDNAAGDEPVPRRKMISRRDSADDSSHGPEATAISRLLVKSNRIVGQQESQATPSSMKGGRVKAQDPSTFLFTGSLEDWSAIDRARTNRSWTYVTNRFNLLSQKLNGLATKKVIDDNTIGFHILDVVGAFPAYRAEVLIRKNGDTSDDRALILIHDAAASKKYDVPLDDVSKTFLFALMRSEPSDE